MDSYIYPVVDLLSVLTVAANISALIILVALVTNALLPVRRFVSHHALMLMLIVALIATCGSLFLSEIAGWAPCKLCWLQRIFMYPQVVLLIMAMWKRDRGIAPYVLALSIIGALIAILHYHEQIVATFFTPPADSLEPCDATGVSCAKTYTFRFGYITVPMMALSAFTLNILGSWSVIRNR